MKLLSRHVLLLAAALAVAGCNKKTTSAEVPAQPEAAEPSTPGEGAVTEVDKASTDPATGKSAKADGAGTPAEAGAVGLPPLDDSQLLGLLPAEDRARYEAWFKKNNLPFNAGVLDQDTDGDGYSNREEFLNNTDPRSASSLPGVMEGVSVKTVNEVQIPLILREVKGGKAKVESTTDGVLEEVAQGSHPKGLPYKVTGVKREIKADKHGVLSDVSNVTLENPQTKESVVLIRDLPARSSETNAVLIGADGTEQKVRIDDVITLPGQGGKKFKVVDLRADQVVVEDMQTKRPITIPKR